jgi:hypothetical protein
MCKIARFLGKCVGEMTIRWRSARILLVKPCPLCPEHLFGIFRFARYYWGLDPHSLFYREVSGSYGWAWFRAWQPT